MGSIGPTGLTLLGLLALTTLMVLSFALHAHFEKRSARKRAYARNANVQRSAAPRPATNTPANVSRVVEPPPRPRMPDPPPEEISDEEEPDMASQGAESASDDSEEEKDAREIFEENFKPRDDMDFAATFEQAMAAAPGLSFNDALDVVFEGDYEAKDVARVLRAHDCSLKDAARRLNEVYTLNLREMFDALSVLPDKLDVDAMSQIVAAIGNIWELDDEAEELLTLFGEIDFPLVDSPLDEGIKILHEQTSLRLGDLVAKMEVQPSTDGIARWAEMLDVDLADSDEYYALRDDNLDFVDACKVLKARGCTAEEILDAENEYDSFDLDSFGDMMDALTEAGFTAAKALEGVWEADFADDNNAGEVVAKALDHGVSCSTIIAVLKKKNLDLDDLQDEMMEAEAPSRESIRILHALHSANEEEEEEPEESSDEETAGQETAD